MLKKQVNKKFKVLFLTLCLYFILGLITFADDWHVEIYSGELLLEPVDAVPYLNEEGRTMVPVRFIAESFGAKVNWNSETQMVTLVNDQATVEFKVNSYVVKINGQKKMMDTQMILDASTNRTFVPFRFAVEPLGISIENVEFLENKILKIELEEQEGLFNLTIGTSVDEVIRQLGQPTSKGLSAYGYEWWFYADDYLKYLQVGISNDEVVVLYTNSDYWQYEGTTPTMTREALIKWVGIKDPLLVDYDKVSLKIVQVPSKERYLNIMGDIAVEWFYDVHDDKISSIRLSKMPYILTQNSYGFNYSFFKETPPNYVPEKLSDKNQLEVDLSNSMMLFYMTNASRVKRGLRPLEFDEEIEQLSISHSKDMYDNDFFDHISPTTGSLGDRFKAWHIPFRSIMENIAYGQADGVYAHEGLMNSLGHRNNILNESSTHVGVGSYFKYYTIDFKEALSR